MKPLVLKKPGGKACIQVVGTRFKNVDYIDVRNFYLAGEEFKPTPKGIMVPVDQVEAVAAAMLKQLEVFGKVRDDMNTPKLYVLLPADKADRPLNRELKIAEYRIFESYVEAKKYRKKAEGDVIFAFLGDYELVDKFYVFSKNVKKRRVATFNDAVWVKQTSL
jgi:hypothetical protein